MATAAARPIYIGYPWSIELKLTNAGVLFPAGATFRAQVRKNAKAAKVYAEISTGSGLERVDDQTIAISFTAEQTATFPTGEDGTGTVEMDIVRSDLNPDEHLGVAVTMNTLLPITRQST